MPFYSRIQQVDRRATQVIQIYSMIINYNQTLPSCFFDRSLGRISTQALDTIENEMKAVILIAHPNPSSIPISLSMLD